MTFKWGILSKNQEVQYPGWDWAFLDIISNLNPLVIVGRNISLDYSRMLRNGNCPC